MAPGGVSRSAGRAGTPPTSGWEWSEDPTAVICCAAGLPAAARAALEAAGRSQGDPARCRQLLASASALAPGHPATLIGEYRFHFYGGRLDEALAVGLRALAWAARTARLALDWRQVRRTDARFGDFDAALPRFYLFCLKGCGYLRARLGDREGGAEMLRKLCELDPADRLGGQALLRVLARQGRDDDDELD